MNQLPLFDDATATPPSLVAEVENLRHQLDEASYAYYVKAKPIMSDVQYDQMFQMLQRFERDNPALVTADSPTQRIGSDLDAAFDKVRHPRPVLSLSNAFTSDDVRNWQQRNSMMYRPPTMSQALTPKQVGYIMQPKMDGSTLVLHYKDGVLVQGVTRGNGTEGDDVTANARTIRNVPLRLNGEHSDVPAYVVVRGEVVIHKADFEKMVAAGENYANPRNLAAGSLKQKNSKETSKRPLRFYPFDILVIEPAGAGVADRVPAYKVYPAYLDMLGAMLDWGFDAVPTEHHESLSDVIAEIPSWGASRPKWPYETDGVVVRVNHMDYFERLGYVGKDPRGALAFKFPAEEVPTTLLGVQITVGRTGMIQPNAILAPVHIGGVTIRNASLHNYELIAALDLREGDTVIVKRAGEVIPYVVRVDDSKPRGTEEILPPNFCPYCGSPVVERGARYFCSNAACPERLIRQIEYWVGKEQMGIDNFGSSTARMLVEKGLVKSPADLYRLTLADFLTLPNFGKNKAETLVTAIQASKDAPWWKVLVSIGMEGIGHSTAKILDPIGGFHHLWQATPEQLAEYEGMGKTTIATLDEWLHDTDNAAFLAELEKAGLNMNRAPVDPATVLPQTLAGRKFVITGTHSVGRDELEFLIEAHGGKVSGSVSKNTSYLVAGDAAGSKLDKANALGVKVIDEPELRRLAATLLVIPDND